MVVERGELIVVLLRPSGRIPRTLQHLIQEHPCGLCTDGVKALRSGLSREIPRLLRSLQAEVRSDESTMRRKSVRTEGKEHTDILHSNESSLRFTTLYNA